MGYQRRVHGMASLVSLLLLLVSVAFFTLLERKVLGYLILRRGPNKPALAGCLVPFANALKLLSKPFIIPSLGSPFLVRFSCFLSFLIPSLLWVFAATSSSLWDWSHSLLSVLIWMSFSVYALLAAGWGSNSKYSILGGTRSIAQCISYEVCFSLLLLSFCLFTSFGLFSIRCSWGFLAFTHLVAILFLVVLAETNRSPFDSRRASRSWCQGITLSILVLALWSFFCLSTFLFSSCPFSAPPFPVLVPTFPLSSFAFFMLFRLFGCVVLYLGFVMINSCHCLENACCQ